MYLYARPTSVLFNQLLVTSNIASYSGALTYFPSKADKPWSSGLVSIETFLNLFGSKFFSNSGPNSFTISS